MARYTPAIVTAVALVLPAPAQACPVCDRETGREVREGIFDRDFAVNLVAAASPFGVFLGLAAAILTVGRTPATPREGPCPTNPTADP